MTAAWSEQLPTNGDYSQRDRRAWASLGLALVGAAALLGTVAGGCYGAVRIAAEALHDGGDDQ